MNKRQRIKQRNLTDDVGIIRSWMQHYKAFTARWVCSVLGIPMGRVRHALHVLNRQGEIRQSDRSNWNFGSVHRAAGRTWVVTPPVPDDRAGS